MVSLPFPIRSKLSCSNTKTEYSRSEQLPRLLKLWPNEVEDYSYLGTLRIAALLQKALRAERRRGRESHWAYDLNRHLGLIDALKHERAHLELLKSSLPIRTVKPATPSEPRKAGTLKLGAEKGGRGDQLRFLTPDLS